MDEPWPFAVPPNLAVITTKYVTRDRLPILYVTHEDDEEGGANWQFHCGNGDYSSKVIQLVGLGEIVRIDPTICALADLPIGSCAKRKDALAEWVIEKEDH